MIKHTKYTFTYSIRHGLDDRERHNEEQRSPVSLPQSINTKNGRYCARDRSAWDAEGNVGFWTLTAEGYIVEDLLAARCVQDPSTSLAYVRQRVTPYWKHVRSMYVYY